MDLNRVFEEQRKLTQKFLVIERKNIPELYQQLYWDVNNPSHQVEIRLQLWWIMEEVFEVYTAGSRKASIAELPDVLHFIVELLIRLRVTAKEAEPYTNFPDHPTLLMAGVQDLNTALVYMSRTLKNKPWKQSHTDAPRHVLKRDSLIILNRYINLVDVFSVGPEELEDLYFHKADTNHDRIHTRV